MLNGNNLHELSIDKKTLGGYLRAMRKREGFKNTEEFSKALMELAGYYVAPQTIYRIEAGKQDPSLSYICAVSIALDGEIISFSMKNMIDASACEEWQQVQEETKQKRLDAYRQAERTIREKMVREGLSTYEDPETGDIYF